MSRALPACTALSCSVTYKQSPDFQAWPSGLTHLPQLSAPAFLPSLQRTPMLFLGSFLQHVCGYLLRARPQHVHRSPVKPGRRSVLCHLCFVQALAFSCLKSLLLALHYPLHGQVQSSQPLLLSLSGFLSPAGDPLCGPVALRLPSCDRRPSSVCRLPRQPSSSQPPAPGPCQRSRDLRCTLGPPWTPVSHPAGSVCFHAGLGHGVPALQGQGLGLLITVPTTDTHGVLSQCSLIE